jgi:hypothetical protein
MQGPYADLIVDAADVCSNCLKKVRVERVDPVRGGLTSELDDHLEREKTRTEIGYGPSDSPAHAKGVFCQCGVEGVHERVWSPTDVTRDRFERLLRAAVQTLDEKGVSFRRKETIMYALSHYDDHGDVDRALANAIDSGIVAEVASGEREKQ